MEVDFNRAALAEALSLVTPVVPSRTPKPILQCVHMQTEGGAVHISATDLEVGIKLAVSQVEIKEAGEVVVPADKLAPIVRESIDEVLSMKVAEQRCKIKGSDSNFTIYCQNPEQYPAVPGFDGEPQLKMSLEALQGGIEQSLFATAKESTRYALNGVLWEIEDKKLLLVATDGRRLARVRLNLAEKAAKEIIERKMIVPAKTMGLLDKIGQSGKDMVNIRLGENQVIVRCGNVIVASNLVDGNFPKYEDIIPSGYEKKLTLSTEATLSAVRRSSLLTSAESRGIRLSVTRDKVVFSCRAPESGDATIEMPVEYDSEPIEIGFNPSFLIDVLRVVKTPEFDLQLGQPDRPGIIKSGSEFLYVLMPINLG